MKGKAQRDSTVTKKDVIDLKRKDSAVSVKIESQIQTVNQKINKLSNREPKEVIRYRPGKRGRTQIDSFYVYVDTCETIQHDTIWMQAKILYPVQKKESWIKKTVDGIFHKSRDAAKKDN